MKYGAFKIVILYVSISVLWITLSDRALFLIGHLNPTSVYFLSSAKGFAFVGLTGLMLYKLINFQNRYLITSEKQYRSYFECNPNPMWIYNKGTLRFVAVNDAAIINYGYSHSEFLKMRILDIRPDEDSENVVDSIKDLNGAYHNSGMWRHIKKNGTLIYVNIISHPVKLNNKDNVMVMAVDNTDKLLSEQQLHKANHRLHLVNEELNDQKQKLSDALERYDLASRATNDVLYDFDLLNNKLIYSQNSAKLMNISFQDLENTSQAWLDLVHPDDLEKVIATHQKSIINSENIAECEYRINCGNNCYKYVHDKAYLIFNDDHIPVRMIGAIRDIDELKRTGEENKRMAEIMAMINNLVLVTDEHMHTIWVNKAFENLTGYTLHEIAGKLPVDFVWGPAPDPELLNNMISKSKTLEPFSVELPFYTRHNKPLWVYADITPLFTDKGLHSGYIIVHTDITTLKKKESSLLKQNNTLRELAWMGSHEVRRPLSSILALTELAKCSTDETEKQELLELLCKCSEELDAMVNKINHRINEAMTTDDDETVSYSPLRA